MQGQCAYRGGLEISGFFDGPVLDVCLLSDDRMEHGIPPPTSAMWPVGQIIEKSLAASMNEAHRN
jgi:hypothetical protein